jgi:hypothetical protein
MMMIIMRELSPSSIYMRGKGDQQYNVILSPYKQPTISSCRPTQVKHSSRRVHMSCSKVMSYTIRAPRWCSYSRCVHTSPFQGYMDSITPLKPCTPMGQFPLQEHCHSLGVLEPTLSLQPGIQATPCHLGSNALLQDAQCSSSQVGHSPRKWISPCIHN